MWLSLFFFIFGKFLRNSTQFKKKFLIRPFSSEKHLLDKKEAI